MKWHFYSPDSDRTSGWTNHCYVLQFVCSGQGRTLDEATADAQRHTPTGFHLPEDVTAIRAAAHHPATLSP